MKLRRPHQELFDRAERAEAELASARAREEALQADFDAMDSRRAFEWERAEAAEAEAASARAQLEQTREALRLLDHFDRYADGTDYSGSPFSVEVKAFLAAVPAARTPEGRCRCGFDECPGCEYDAPAREAVSASCGFAMDACLCPLPRGHEGRHTCAHDRAREAVSADTPEQDSGSPTGSVVNPGSVGGASEDVSK